MTFSSKFYKIIGFILLILLTVFLFWHFNNKPTLPPVNTDSIKTKIDSTKTQRDTLIKDIDNSKETIKEIEKSYEKDSIVITKQSTDSDIVFFREYLSTNFK